MEVIVGEEEATSLPDTQLEESGVNKTFVPVAWAAAYGRVLDEFCGNPLLFFPLILSQTLFEIIITCVYIQFIGGL